MCILCFVLFLYVKTHNYAFCLSLFQLQWLPKNKSIIYYGFILWECYLLQNLLSLRITITSINSWHFLWVDVTDQSSCSKLDTSRDWYALWMYITALSTVDELSATCFLWSTVLAWLLCNMNNFNVIFPVKATWIDVYTSVVNT